MNVTVSVFTIINISDFVALSSFHVVNFLKL